MKKGILLVLIMIVFVTFSYCENNKQYYSEKVSISPCGRYEIIKQWHQIGDNVLEETYSIIGIKTKEKKELFKHKRKDSPKPQFFWAKNKKLLIYDRLRGIDSKSVLEFYSIKEEKVLFYVSGHLAAFDKSNQQFFYIRTKWVDKKKQLVECCICTVKVEKDLKEKILYKFKTSYWDWSEVPTIELFENKKLLRFKRQDLWKVKDMYFYQGEIYIPEIYIRY